MFEPKLEIYKDLQSKLTLDDNDRIRLRSDRGFTDSTIDTLGFKTAKPENEQAIKEMVQTYGLGNCLACGLVEVDESPAWQWTKAGNIIIPYYDERKDIYLYKSHKQGSLNHAPVMPYSEFTYNNVKNNQVIVCESEFKAAAMWQLGYKALGLGGITTFSSQHIDKLIGMLQGAKQIIILFDNAIQDDPKLPSYKKDFRARYSDYIWSFIMANRIDKLMNTMQVDEDGNVLPKKEIDIRVATLPMEWDTQGKGKVDIDYALATGRERKHFDIIIRNAMSPEFYREHINVPKDHKPMVLRAMAKAVKSGLLYDVNNCYWTTEVKNKKAVKKKLSNFVINVKASIETADGIWREFQLISEYGEYSPYFKISGEDMSSFQTFKKACLSRGDFLWEGQEPHWNMVIAELFYETDIATVKMLPMIGRNDKLKSWFFGNMILTDEGKEYSTLDDGITFRLPKSDYRIEPFSDEPMPELSKEPINIGEVFTKFVEGYGMGGVECWAYMIASCFSNPFFEQYGFFPHILLHGERQAGKSTLSDIMVAMAGYPSSIRAMNMSETTQVAMARKLAYYHSLPCRFDEYRQGEKKIEDKTSAMRSFYNRQGASKGMRNPFGVREVIINGTSIIIGEQRIEDPALLSRCIQVELTPQNKTKVSYDAMRWLYDHSKSLSYIYYNLIKNYQQNAAEFLKSVEDTRRGIGKRSNEMADSRTQIHYAMLMAALGLNRDVKEVIDFQKRLLGMFSDAVHDVESGSVLSTFFDDLIMMRNMGEPVNNYLSIEFTDLTKGNLHLNELINLWLKFKQQHGGGRKFDQHTIRSYLKKQPFFVKDGTIRRFKLGETTFRGRATVIDLIHEGVPDCVKILFKHIKTQAWDDDDVEEDNNAELDFKANHG